MNATNHHAATITTPSDTEVVITRDFGAPPDVVFAAMTEPDHIRKWYGLEHLEMTACEMDLRAGGAWRFAQADAEGNEFAFSGVIREVDPPHRVVFTEEFEMMPGTEYVVTATYEEVAPGTTRLRAHLQYQAREHRDGHLESGMEHGLNESYDRLDRLVRSMA